MVAAVITKSTGIQAGQLFLYGALAGIVLAVLYFLIRR